MADITILTATERYDQILSAMVKDLENYKTDMEAALAEIGRALTALEKSWQGDAEAEFQYQMREHMRGIGASVTKVDRVSAEVEAKIVPIRRALAKMRGQQ